MDCQHKYNRTLSDRNQTSSSRSNYYPEQLNSSLPSSSTGYSNGTFGGCFIGGFLLLTLTCMSFPKAAGGIVMIGFPLVIVSACIADKQ
jgi:hypothetical protein